MPPTPANGWGVQGNLAWTKAQHEAELEKAALAARQKKALMQSMASVSHRPPTITTAEQFLEVHKPAAPRSPEGGGSAPIARSNPYVPQFENTTARTGRGETSGAPASQTPAVTAPEKKSGLLGLFKPKEKESDFSTGSSSGPPSPAATYPETTPDGIGSTEAPVGAASGMTPVDPAAPEAALDTATTGDTVEKKPSLFGRLFAKEKEAPPAPATVASTPYPAPGGTPAPPAPPTETAAGIPAPPSFDDPAPAKPAPMPPAPATAPEVTTGSEAAPASIFVDRSRPAAPAPAASVLTTTQATVSGVLVRLYEGTEVSVLERNGSMARVRLPDGREGTIAASALSR